MRLVGIWAQSAGTHSLARWRMRRTPSRPATATTGAISRRKVFTPSHRSFEKEADYIGTYFAARAGYDVSGAGEFWRRYGIANQSRIRAEEGDTHPGTATRYLDIENTAHEIAIKSAAGETLTPVAQDGRKLGGWVRSGGVSRPCMGHMLHVPCSYHATRTGGEDDAVRRGTL